MGQAEDVFYDVARQYSRINKQRFELLFDVGKDHSLNGCIVECGVMYGGSLAALSCFNDREVWGFDSFEGCPKPETIDYQCHDNKIKGEEGSCAGDPTFVTDLLFNGLKLNPNRFHIIKGWFVDTLLKHKDKIPQIAIFHIDGDWYESTKICLETLYDKVSVGGWVICDDYGYWAGANLAVHEFIADKPITLERFSTHGVWWKKI